MSSEQTFSTADLRSHSVDHKREVTSKVKWAHGAEWKDGRDLAGHPAPSKRRGRLDVKRNMGNRAPREVRLAERSDMINELHSSESSADEDAFYPVTTTDLDAQITYSYDAAHGPSHGSQILSLAVAKAAERYETKVTDNLVRKEWEMLDETGEVLPKSAGKRSAKRVQQPLLDVEAEYEFV